MEELPHDLYIPPDALEVVLEIFEGPLDLLLYLIRKHNLNILNIPVAQVIQQYLQYMAMMRHFRLELAAEYLEMAALLMEIKSRMLLPALPDLDSSEVELDPRLELVRKLQAYEQFKKAAEGLEALPRLERDWYLPAIQLPTMALSKPLPVVQLQDIVRTFHEVMSRSDLKTMHKIQKEVLTVREKMALILDSLASLASSESREWTTFWVFEEGCLGVVVTFLALLELTKESLLELVQNESFGPIYVRTITH